MVKHFVQSNAGVALCMIVPELLKEDNYERWSIFMQHYLMAQDFWDVVLSSEMLDREDPREWIKRNALALHAIKISCGEEMFDEIKKMNSAKDAWNALAKSHKHGNKDTVFPTSTVERKQAVTLLKDIKKGDSDAVRKYFETHPPYCASLENGSTALHVAIAAGQVKLAKELISVMSEEELETQDESFKTVLSLAACKGSKEIAECLVGKNKKLLEIPDCEEKIPLVLACARHHKSLTSYLAKETPKELLDPRNGHDHGFFFLKECIRNHMFDIGLDLLRQFPDLIFHKSSLDDTPIISVLVEILSSLFAGNKLVLFGEELIYKFCQWRAYDLKYGRANPAREMVRFICEKLSTLEREHLMSTGAVEATFKAIKLGYVDFVKQITEANPDILWSHDTEHSRNMLMYAVAHRQKEIAKFLYKLDQLRIMTEFTIDDQKNNILHLAAKLAPSCPSCIQDISDPVLQMQSEANWFKEVERIVPKFYKEQRNKDGKTPSEVFKSEHQSLLKEAQKWVKDTVNFAAVIGTLIIGIMFAALITVPGGSEGHHGIPIFSGRPTFNLFLGSDVASMFFASLSVVLFLDIHKSSLSENDFLTIPSLTARLALTFYLLYWSIGTTLICSFASIRLVDIQHTSPIQIFIFSCPFVYIFLRDLLPFFKMIFLSRIFSKQNSELTAKYRALYYVV